jgi:hypothetical protein
MSTTRKPRTKKTATEPAATEPAPPPRSANAISSHADEELISDIRTLLRHYTPGTVAAAIPHAVAAIERAAELGTSYSAAQWEAAARAPR